MDRSLKHHAIAAGAGDNDSLKKIQELYSEGHASKEDYTKAYDPTKNTWDKE